MPFIAFLGCDGCGKSAVIQGLKSQLEAEGHQVTLGHWRPRTFDTGSSQKANHADDPHGQSPRGLAGSILKLGWLWLNWWTGWFLSLRSQSRNGFVLFDRYHGDLLADPLRYRYGGPMWLARLVSRLMPQPDLIIFLDAEPDILISRKQEVGIEALESARRKYLKFRSDNTRCRIIDASQTLEMVISNTKAVVTGLNPQPHNSRPE